MVTIKEIKSTIAIAIAGAFGFIIALIWKDIIIGANLLKYFLETLRYFIINYFSSVFWFSPNMSANSFWILLSLSSAARSTMS